MNSFTYKTVSFLEFSQGYSFFDTDFNDIFDETLTNDKLPTKTINNNYNDIKYLTITMKEAWKVKNSDKMDQALADLIQISQEMELLYSIDLINCKLILYSCLETDSPYNLTTKTLKLISQILRQKNEKVLGESFISDDDSVSLIDVLFQLTCHFLESRSKEENEEKYLTMIHTLICLNIASTFNIDASELILKLFFTNPPYVILDIINLNSSESSFPQYVELLKYCCSKLICNLTQMKINSFDAENLFCFICTNWESIYNSNEGHMNDETISYSMKNLIKAVYNFIKLIPVKWKRTFLSCDAWNLVESCLVVDKIDIATPAIKCVLQLLVENVEVKVNYPYFINLIQSYKDEDAKPIVETTEDSVKPDESKSNENSIPTENSTESKSLLTDENLVKKSNKSKIENSIRTLKIPSIENSMSRKVQKIENREKTFDNPLSLACYAIEFMTAQNKEHAQQLVSIGLFNTISEKIEKIPIKYVTECVSCVCAVINSKITNCIDSILESNIIEILIEFASSRLNDLMLLQIINALHQIFNLAIVNGRQQEVLEQFDNSDGNDAMEIISNDNIQLVNESLQSFCRTYSSLQNQS